LKSGRVQKNLMSNPQIVLLFFLFLKLINKKPLLVT